MAVVVVNADARAIPLPDQSVQCVITSPPYWGLRDYGQATQIGLEKTPDEYVASICQVFDEIWRVLRADGTCWLNLGDSYAREGGRTAGVSRHWDGRTRDPGGLHDKKPLASDYGAKAKDLIGIPWRVAFALQARGWYLRSAIIWAKPNPMPESVTDRPTKSHEYIFLLTKNEKYFYDAFAVKEFSAGGAASGRNRRSVWTITPKPYSGAHFATFPPDLVEPCLLAGTPMQSCADCGAPYHRVVERGPERREQQIACGANANGGYHGTATKDFTAANAQDASATKARILAGMVEKKTIGWKQTCRCTPAFVAPAIVLDPFGGSGTVGVVATTHGRDAFVIDRKMDYCQLAVTRQERKR